MVSIIAKTILKTLWGLLLEYWQMVLVALAVAFVYWSGYHNRGKECAADRLGEINTAIADAVASKQRVQDKSDKLARALEQTLAKQRAQVTILSRSLQDEISKNAVYRECRPTADGVRALNDTIAGRSSTR